MRRAAPGSLIAGALAVVALASPAAAQHAPDLETAPAASLWAALGATVPLERPGADRAAGPSAMFALDQEITSHVAVRFELSGELQQLATGTSAVLDGDIQQARVMAAARLTPISFGAVAPYALAGIGAAWQSERLMLRDALDPVPDASFQQTTSTTARVVLLGVGVRMTGERFGLFGESRWTRAAVYGVATTDLGVVAGLSLPIPR